MAHDDFDGIERSGSKPLGRRGAKFE